MTSTLPFSFRRTNNFNNGMKLKLISSRVRVKGCAHKRCRAPVVIWQH